MLVYSVAVLESRLWILASGSTQASLPQDSGTNLNTAAAAATRAELPEQAVYILIKHLHLKNKLTTLFYLIKHRHSPLIQPASLLLQAIYNHQHNDARPANSLDSPFTFFRALSLSPG